MVLSSPTGFRLARGCRGLYHRRMAVLASMLLLPLAPYVRAEVPDDATVIESFAGFKASHLHASWQEAGAQIDAQPQQLRVKAKSFGGAYKYLGGKGQSPDLSKHAELVLEVTVDEKSSAGDGRVRFLVMLEDRDGTVLKYSSPGHGEGEQTVRWALAEPSSLGEAGKTAGFDYSDVQAINVFIDPAGGAFEATFHDL